MHEQVLRGHGHIVAISLEAKDDALLDRAVERYQQLLQVCLRWFPALVPACVFLLVSINY